MDESRVGEEVRSDGRTVSLRAQIGLAAERLAGAGVESARIDAELLAAHVLGGGRTALFTAAAFAGERLERYESLVAERASRIPLQHLTGIAGFRRLELAVGPGVFVPRPETEMIAQWVIDRVGELPAASSPVVVDLCTGSGAIALSIAQECPQGTVYAVEAEAHAHAWARRNADNRVAQGDRPIELSLADATAAETLAELDGTVDVVVTNPPYVPDGARVPPEVADHDPAAALWGGPDGLVIVRRLVARAERLLRPGGLIAIEHADSQGESLPALVRRTGAWIDVQDHPDLTGRPRFTTARLADAAGADRRLPAGS